MARPFCPASRNARSGDGPNLLTGCQRDRTDASDRKGSPKRTAHALAAPKTGVATHRTHSWRGWAKSLSEDLRQRPRSRPKPSQLGALRLPVARPRAVMPACVVASTFHALWQVNCCRSSHISHSYRPLMLPSAPSRSSTIAMKEPCVSRLFGPNEFSNVYDFTCYLLTSCIYLWILTTRRP